MEKLKSPFAASRLWTLLGIAWLRLRLIPASKWKMIVHAALAAGCFRLSPDDQLKLQNAIFDLAGKTLDMIGSASILLALINGFHKEKNPAIVTAKPTIITTEPKP